MSKSLFGDTSKTAVSQYAVMKRQRDVLTKQVKAGQQTVVATEPKIRDGGSRELINVKRPISFEFSDQVSAGKRVSPHDAQVDEWSPQQRRH